RRSGYSDTRRRHHAQSPAGLSPRPAVQLRRRVHRARGRVDVPRNPLHRAAAGGANHAVTRALVTGAAGFIGSHVVDHCLALGMEVTAVDDLSGGCLENVSLQADWVKGDVRDPAFVDSLWAGRRFDYVYHLAAYAAEGLSHFIRRYNYETNLVGSVNLINASI